VSFSNVRIVAALVFLIQTLKIPSPSLSMIDPAQNDRSIRLKMTAESGSK
jgi:hypothetical protein